MKILIKRYITEMDMKEAGDIVVTEENCEAGQVYYEVHVIQKIKVKPAPIVYEKLKMDIK